MSDVDDETPAVIVEEAPDRELGAQVSRLDARVDPFSVREGKALTWQGICMTLAGRKNGEDEKKILQDVWGEVPPKETTAIIGPSGSGKTSLLNILSGRAASRGRMSIEADVRLDNFVVDPSKVEVRKQIAFVAQDDSLQITSTPREAIRFSAKLRLPRSTSDHQLEKLTNRMLAELGLTSCADTIVGGALVKGISGGERKRTSVGVELVVKPALVFLDEPTSGLDSFSAVQLCQVLKKVANAGASVLFTIHQPSSEIFNSFDHLILLNKGRVMYQGSVSKVPDYFAERGRPNPPNYNPADWIMNVAQSVKIEELIDAGFFPEDEREMPEPFESDEKHDALGISITKHFGFGSCDEDFDTRKVGPATETYELFKRELKNLKRDTMAVGSRFGIAIFLSLLVGAIFFEVGKSDLSVDSNINSVFGALIMVLMGGMFGTAQPALLQFPEERPVFLREYSTNHYSVASYFCSRLTMEALVTAAQCMVSLLVGFFMIGFQQSFIGLFAIDYLLAMASTALAVCLGCAVGDPKLASEAMPILFVPQMLFAGFFVTPDLIPSWLRWASYICSLTYAVRLALIGEFDRDCGGGKADDNCQQVLNNVEADPDESWWYWLMLVVLFAVFRLLAVILLRMKATKFY